VSSLRIQLQLLVFTLARTRAMLSEAMPCWNGGLDLNMLVNEPIRKQMRVEPRSSINALSW
jgi:hypothetical protein